MTDQGSVTIAPAPRGGVVLAVAELVEVVVVADLLEGVGLERLGRGRPGEQAGGAERAARRP